MKNKELKEILNNLPDDYEVVVDVPDEKDKITTWTIDKVVRETFTVPLTIGLNSIEKIENVIVIKL